MGFIIMILAIFAISYLLYKGSKDAREINSNKNDTDLS